MYNRLTHYLKGYGITGRLSLTVRRETGVIASGVARQTLQNQRVIAEDYTGGGVIF